MSFPLVTREDMLRMERQRAKDVAAAFARELYLGEEKRGNRHGTTTWSASAGCGTCACEHNCNDFEIFASNGEVHANCACSSAQDNIDGDVRALEKVWNAFHLSKAPTPEAVAGYQKYFPHTTLHDTATLLQPSPGRVHQSSKPATLSLAWSAPPSSPSVAAPGQGDAGARRSARVSLLPVGRRQPSIQGNSMAISIVPQDEENDAVTWVFEDLPDGRTRSIAFAGSELVFQMLVAANGLSAQIEKADWL